VARDAFHPQVAVERVCARTAYDAALITEVEVKFIAEGGNTTRIELEHRYLERMGEKAADMRSRADSPAGWGAIVERFRIYAEG
jgi:hypothetical protein